MADLHQAYGGLDSDSYAPNDYYNDMQESEKPVIKEPVKQKVSPPVQHMQPPQQFTMPAHEFAPPPVQTAPSAQASAAKRNPSYSFSDRMAMKRGEVIKLAMFSLVIVLAISLERIGTHYLNKYLSDNLFTEFQEFMLRLSYPVIVFIVLWVIKSL
jgi:hypothetical protein